MSGSPPRIVALSVADAADLLLLERLEARMRRAVVRHMDAADRAAAALDHDAEAYFVTRAAECACAADLTARDAAALRVEMMGEEGAP